MPYFLINSVGIQAETQFALSSPTIDNHPVKFATRFSPRVEGRGPYRSGAALYLHKTG